MGTDIQILIQIKGLTPNFPITAILHGYVLQSKFSQID